MPLLVAAATEITQELLHSGNTGADTASTDHACALHMTCYAQRSERCAV
jgi:hypothetical protein